MFPVLHFSKDWNGKLRNSHFFTIRLHKNYWKKHVGKIVKIKLKGSYLGVAYLYYVDTETFRNLPEFFVELDTGMKKEEAYQLFHRMYSRKPQWKDMETLFDVLFLFWWGVGWETEPWAKYQNLGGDLNAE